MSDSEQMLQDYTEGMQTYEQVMNDYYDEINKKDLSVLRKAKKYLGRVRYQLLLDELEEQSLDGEIWLVDIVNESSVNQKLKTSVIDECLMSDYIYVHQTVGYLGDDYSGYVCIPISGKKKKHRKCIKFQFSC